MRARKVERTRRGITLRGALPHLTFAVTLIALVSMSFALYDEAKKARESTAYVAHSHEVLRTISDVDYRLSRAESAIRGYVVSGDWSFVTERDVAVTTLHDSLETLVFSVADNPLQHARAEKLRELVESRLKLLQTAVVRHDAGTQVSAQAVRSAQHVRGEIDDLLGELNGVEQDLLRARQQQEERRYASTLALLIAIGVLAALIVIPSYVAFLMQSRARARLESDVLDMADSIPGVVYRYRSFADGTSRYEFLSPAVSELYGVDRDAAHADASVIGDLVIEEDRGDLRAAIALAAEHLTPLDHEFRVRSPDGTLIWVRSVAAPRQLADGSVLWNGHWADITAQKRLEHALSEAKEAAERADRAKSAFLAVMSHEIRTPLNGVLGMLELLSLTELNAEQRATVNVVSASGRSLQRIIDDILDFSKIEAGRLEISPIPASLREVVESTHNLHVGNASSKGLLLTCEVDGAIAPAHVFDPLRLRQILGNFVSNAIKFTASGEVKLAARLTEARGQEQAVRFCVSDNGIGMSEEVQARLFQPFMQADGSTARSFGGTGLGLAISGRLARMMGGSIEVESAPGRGTTMMLTLTLALADPAEVESAPAARFSKAPLQIARAAPSVEQAEREGTLILIADDHPTNRMLLMRQVNTLGYAAVSAKDGAEALELWRTGRFAALLTDCNMPRMDGYTLARRVRAEESATPRSRTPIIACTANALRGEAEACFEAGMDDYLPKPVALSELQRKLGQWLPLTATAQVKSPAAPAVAPAAQSTTPLFDPAVLAEITGGTATLDEQILSEFEASNEQDATALGAALAAGDLDAVARLAHRMKGASRMVGLLALAGACETLERAAKARETEQVAPAAAALENEIERVHTYIGGRLAAAAA